MVSAVAGLVNLLLLRPAPVPSARPAQGGTGSAATGSDTGAAGTLQDRRIWRLGLASLLLMYAQWSVLAFLVLHLTSERGLALGLGAVCLATVQFGGAAGRIAAGRWSDRLGMRVAPMRAVAAAIVVAFVAAAAASAGPDPIAVPVLIVAGILAISWNGLSFAAAAELAGVTRSGTALGLQNTALALGAVIAPPLFGLIISQASWELGLLTIAGVAAVAGWALGPLDERH